MSSTRLTLPFFFFVFFLFCCTSESAISLLCGIVIYCNSIFHKDSLHKSGSFFQLHRLSFVGIVGKLCKNMSLIV